MDMLKICSLGMVATIFGIYFKGIKGEYGVYISIVAGIIIFVCLMNKLEGIIEVIHKVQKFITINNAYIALMIKVIGITYVAEFSSNICKDAGYNALGSQIEVFAKITIMALSIPVIEALISCINGMLL